MVRFFTTIFLLSLSLTAILSCKKDNESKPKSPLPVDTLTADQYIYCEIDTVKFYAYTKDGGPDRIGIFENGTVVTKIKFETNFFRGSQALNRNLELHLYDFLARRPGIYSGSKIFSKGKMDVLQNKVDLLEKNYTIFNSLNNQIVITRSDTNYAKGTFTFKMRSDEDNSIFVEAKNGIFKIKI
jgi:hypothetical protein